MVTELKVTKVLSFGAPCVSCKSTMTTVQLVHLGKRLASVEYIVCILCGHSEQVDE